MPRSGALTQSPGVAGKATIIDDVEARIEAAVSAVPGPGNHGVDPLIGKLIGGRFEVISRLGAGGMGVVYRARQVGIDRIVAIKTLLKDRATDEKVVARFKNEARAVSRLNHPNTIRIFDFGQMDDGTLYFAMELLEGRSLDKAIRQDAPVSARRTLHIMSQMADSLAEAHSKGIVHRDLKPENVYLSQVGDDPDFVKVLDFGVARMREQDSSQGTMTQAGVIFGTPRYMAPEQARTMAVDARADIYALGIIWYELLTGQTPFEADNPLAILMKHIQDPVPPMSVTRPDVAVPAEVEELVFKCLEKSPERRFQSAASLAVELRSTLDRLDGRFERVVFVEREAAASDPIDEQEPWEPEIKVVSRRGPGPILVLIAVLALVGTAAGVGWTMYSRSHVVSSAADAQPDVVQDVGAPEPIPEPAPAPGPSQSADTRQPPDVATAPPDSSETIPSDSDGSKVGPESRPIQSHIRVSAPARVVEPPKPVVSKPAAVPAYAPVPAPAPVVTPQPVTKPAAKSGFEKVGDTDAKKNTTPDKVGDLKSF
ncbi:MAG TPA: serine/threonine-protein kinase [Myxococcota bacterium]|nr:serine/threonine-protein kinase [Myxococcota bacterium]HQP96044.1 serine/threonine-protein kinase [Myxococcota bacterium]